MNIQNSLQFAADIRVKTVISTMESSLTDRLSLNTLSAKVNLSPARLQQLFKLETGRSPMQYLKELRLRKAEDLLQTTFHSIKEIAFLCGATDVSHFVRDFKKHCGLTPSGFRSARKI